MLVDLLFIFRVFFGDHSGVGDSARDGWAGEQNGDVLQHYDMYIFDTVYIGFAWC